MLSKSHIQAYQEFLTLLQKLNDDFLPRKETIEIKSVQQQFQTIKTFFQQEITGLTADQLDRSIATRWQSLQTELYRELRLLETDILFWAAARQAETRAQRLLSVGDRLKRVIGYCTAMKDL